MVSVILDNSYPVHKATIIPTNKALGYVARLPKEDIYNITKKQSFIDLIIAMSGRVAEEVIFGEKGITNGAYGDISQATSMAKEMVIKWGFSHEIGLRYIGNDMKKLHDGSDTGSEYRVSEELLQKIDKEIAKFLDSAYKEAKKIILNNKDKLHLLAAKLIQLETLTGKEIIHIIIGKKK